MPIAVLLVDDDPFVRSALRTLVQSQPDLECVGEAEDGLRACELVFQVRPDVVLIDLAMPGMDGVSAIRTISARRGAPPLVALTNHTAERRIAGALAAGAAGYLLKNSDPQSICAAIRSAATGELVFSQSLLRRLAADFVDQNSGSARAHDGLRELTEREAQVARAVADGLTNQEIADSLQLSLSTVKTNVSRVLTKLHLGNRVQLALLIHGVRGAS